MALGVMLPSKCLLCRFLYNLIEGLMTAPHCQCVTFKCFLVQISLQSHCKSHDGKLFCGIAESSEKYLPRLLLLPNGKFERNSQSTH
jgi:hypothetical protein